MKTNIYFSVFLYFVFCNLAFAGNWDIYNPHAPFNCGCSQSALFASDIPYYALHPPVYYSYPVARTYGDSPFAYPPGSSASQAYSTPAQPQTIKNEYIEESSSIDNQQYQTHTPLRISNPFVEQSDKGAMSKGVKWGGRGMSKPLIIYPASRTLLIK